MFRLADGSAVTLDSDSRATIEFDGAGRRISLTRGRARFDVAHEGRPFLVKAGHGVVTAHGTVFDVQLTEQGQVKVHLLQGRVEVKSHASAGGGSSDRTRAIMLRPNEAAIYADAIPVRRQDRPAGTEAWAAVVQSLDDVPLSSVIELANRNSPTQIILADRSIGEIRVSGRMVINDPTTVADKLARLFQLEAVKTRPVDLAASAGQSEHENNSARYPVVPVAVRRSQVKRPKDQGATARGGTSEGFRTGQDQGVCHGGVGRCHDGRSTGMGGRRDTTDL